MLGLGAALTSGSPASAKPADNGDVKIHNVATSVTDQRNEPKVCAFYLDAFNFDGSQSVNYWFKFSPPFKGPQVLPGSITLDAAGNGHTDTLNLDQGMYKLFFKPDGAKGKDKFKVFKVNCAPTPTTPPTTPPPTTPPPTTPPTTPPPTTPAFTGGGGGVTVTTPGTTQGAGLPFTGDHTGALALWAALGVASGIVMLALGRRTEKARS